MNLKINHYILEYLCFQGSKSHAPAWISKSETSWRHILGFTDAAGLTLYLRALLHRRHHFDTLPSPVKDRLEENLKRNRTRTGVLAQEFLQINRHLQAAGVRYLNLKGLLLHPRFTDRQEHRVQYDFDILVARGDLEVTYSRLKELGFTPAHTNDRQRADHLPPLIRETGWDWRGDFFDPQIPPGVEVHYRLWEPEFERLSILLFEDLWEKASLQEYGSFWVPRLSLNHELLYMTLHCCRHLLRSDLRLSHLYELAYFLHHNSMDPEFWQGFLAWLERCPNSSRMVATVLALGVKLFQPATSPSLRSWIGVHLPQGAERWIKTYGYRDAVHGYRENKNVIFLHLSLLDKREDQWEILKQKLLPRHLPLPISGIYLPEEKKGVILRGFHSLLYLGYLARRAFFHAASFVGLCLNLPAWLWCLRHSSKPEFQR